MDRSGEDVGLSRKGFTLIELLVVIAIIAILASLLLSALSRGKTAVYTAVCRSNLRQLTVALTLYESDANCFPRFTGDVAASGGQLGWDRSLIPYVLEPLPTIAVTGGWLSASSPKSVWICPEYARLGAHLGMWGSPLDWSPYGYNARGVEDPTATGPPKPMLGLGGSGTDRESDLRATQASEIACPVI